MLPIDFHLANLGYIRTFADRLPRLCPLNESNLAISAACAVQLPEGAFRSIRCQSLKGFAVEMAVFIPE